MSKFEVGQLKPFNSGRKKGTPNKKTELVIQALDQLGQDLPQRIMDLLPQLTAKEQVDVCLELMQYVYPKRKATDVPKATTGGQTVIFNIPNNGRDANRI